MADQHILDQLDKVIDTLAATYVRQSYAVGALELGIRENGKLIKHLTSRLEAFRAQEVGGPAAAAAAAAPSSVTHPSSRAPTVRPPGAAGPVSQVEAAIRAVQLGDVRPRSGSSASTSASAAKHSQGSTTPAAAATAPAKVPRALVLPSEFRRRVNDHERVIEGIQLARYGSMDAAASFLLRCDAVSSPNAAALPPPSDLPPWLRDWTLAGLARLEIVSLIEAHLRILAEVEAARASGYGSPGPEIWGLWEEVRAATASLCLPPPEWTSAGLSWANRVLRAVAPHPRPPLELPPPRPARDPALWRPGAVPPRSDPSAPLLYSTPREAVGIIEAEQNLQWASFLAELDEKHVLPLAEEALGLARRGDEDSVSRAALLLRLCSALVGRSVCSIARLEVEPLEEEAAAEADNQPGSAASAASPARGGREGWPSPGEGPAAAGPRRGAGLERTGSGHGRPGEAGGGEAGGRGAFKRKG